jgi:glutamine synthetase
VTFATPYLGAEQEYFLVDKPLFDRRPDLREVGATLLGAGPAKGQQLEDHYFRAIPDRILVFMEDMEQELVRLGVPVKTRHNEVAPAQFELAVLHRPVNIAADQNQLVMETIRRVAPRHGLEALLHEKPFARINGSGKHCNWSLIDSEGTNLLEPGSNQTSHLRFLVFLVAVVNGVLRHGPLLRAVIASASNDLRLGGNEAPPAIISVHLGAQLSALLDDLATGAPGAAGLGEEIDLGLAGVARIPKDTADRNRTSPFAFTGNKFEFRAVGSSAAVSIPNAVLNAMTAQSLDGMVDRIAARTAGGEDRVAAVTGVLRELIEETRAVRFDGDNYTPEWMEEARRRGLVAARTTPEALDALVSESTLELFEGYGLMRQSEAGARHRIRLDFYAKTVTVELQVLRRMLSTQVLPAAVAHQEKLARSYNAAAAALGPGCEALGVQRQGLEEFARDVARLIGAIKVLDADKEALERGGDLKGLAVTCANGVRPHMDEARRVADRLEELVGEAEWPLPSYDEMLIL